MWTYIKTSLCLIKDKFKWIYSLVCLRCCNLYNINSLWVSLFNIFILIYSNQYTFFSKFPTSCLFLWCCYQRINIISCLSISIKSYVIAGNCFMFLSWIFVFLLVDSDENLILFSERSLMSFVLFLIQVNFYIIVLFFRFFLYLITQLPLDRFQWQLPQPFFVYMLIHLQLC